MPARIRVADTLRPPLMPLELMDEQELNEFLTLPPLEDDDEDSDVEESQRERTEGFRRRMAAQA